MKWLKLVSSLIITATLFYFLNFPQGKNLPFPLAKFLNPFAGFWQNNTQTDLILNDCLVPGLVDSVTVCWDDRRVPHIFAQNTRDLYFTQGYLTARNRLWQMEFLTHAAAGRVSEILGPNRDVLKYDRYRRRTGMVYAAENSIKMMLEDDASRLALKAYSAGVNAWIGQLEQKDLPLEYKILNYRPEPWTPLKTALLLKYMAWDLSGYSEELLMTRTRAALGDSVMERLFFRKPLFVKPVIPRGTPWQFQPLPLPQPPETIVSAIPSNIIHPQQPDPGNGSNNWAVSGKKTRSGLPILCNDPHLKLNLPSIWYEVQLVTPEMNVYGVSLPGTPAVIIGFNQHIAWGVTNAATDVLDWYEVEFSDSDAEEYLYDGKWVETGKRIEKIKIRDGETVLDTIPVTHHGLVVYRKHEKSFNEHIPSGTALRWVAHDPSNELAAFIKLNRGDSYADFLEALSHYSSPAQNFAFASAKGVIAIHHHGKFPLRWKRQGRYISDGRDPGYDWKGWIPHDHLPHIKNPGQGFVASANQNPVDSTYPYNLYGKYATFERSARINERLQKMSNITAQDMMALQTDILNMHARTVLPVMLSVLEKQDVSLAETRDIEILREWNYENNRQSTAPIIFETWWQNLTVLIWADDLSDEEGSLLFPGKDVTIDLILNDSSSIYFDIDTTTYRETRKDILLLAFQKTHQQLTEKLGPYGENWKWGNARNTGIMHLLKIKGLGRPNLKTDGNRDIINATRDSKGPSWRMIVELGPEPHAWGIYPGGQSGNPGSVYYDNFVDDWVAGNYYQLLYLKSADKTSPGVVGTTVIRGTK